MDNVLAKKFSFQLDAKSTKMYKEKSFVCYDTDSIELSIAVYEDGTLKILRDSRVEIIYSYPNEGLESIRQTMDNGGIYVSQSTIRILPKSSCLKPTDYLRMDINIYDDDEFITLQPFMFKIVKSVESEAFEKAEDIVKNMKSISEQMAEVLKDIEDLKGYVNEKGADIDRQTQEMVESLNENILTTNGKLADFQTLAETRIAEFVEVSNNRIDNFVNESYQEVNLLMDKIQDTNVELDEVFLRSAPLTPMDNNGKLSFSTDWIMKSPYSLVNKSYILNVTGSPYNQNVITSNIGILYFTLENGDVVAGYASMVNKSVQSKNITVSIQFDNAKSSMPISAYSFKIIIQTNLLTNLIDNATCTITSNASIGNLL